MPTIDNGDRDLLRMLLAGDEAAFVALYHKHRGGVYRYALHMSGSDAVAEDVTQEVFMALLREAGNFDPAKGALGAYLYGIARHHVLRRFSKKNHQAVPIIDGGEDSAAPPAAAAALLAPDDPLGDLTRRETILAVRRAVLRLPEHYREVLVLCELNEVSYAEAAEVLGCAVGTVRSRLHRARALLIEKLRDVKNSDAPAEQLTSTRCFA